MSANCHPSLRCGCVMCRNNLGGFDGQLANAKVADGVIITAPAVYNSSGVTYAAIRGAGSLCPHGRVGDLIGLKCAPQPLQGSCSLVSAHSSCQ